MAFWASCLICLKSSRRAGEAGLLVLDMASPTTTARLGSLQRDSTHGHKVVGDDAPADVSFKANLTLIKGSPHPKAVFERAKARFNACSPALTTPKPALFTLEEPDWGLNGRGQADPLP